MKTLHNIKPSEGVTFWLSQDGRETPFDQLDSRHMDNILRRFGPVYLKGNLRGEREKMFEGVVLEWTRRYGHIRRVDEL